jgi:RNA polymerase sigma-70 factor (ECF subfamily)
MEQPLALDGVSENQDARFERLFHDYHSDIYVYLCRLVGDRRQAEDLSQETFVKAYRALSRLPVEANSRAWLYRIATNTALDCLRRRRLVSWLPLFERDAHPAVQTSFAESTLESVVVEKTLSQLGARYRIPLVLYACQGLSTQEIAEILRISRGAVKTRLFRAREQFRRLYGAKEDRV